MTHKWNTPYEWLKSHIADMSVDELKILILGLASYIGSEGVCGKYQSLMERDGYFEDESPSPTPYELGRKQGYIADGERHHIDIPYAVCPYRNEDKRRVEWTYGYLDGREDRLRDRS